MQTQLPPVFGHLDVSMWALYLRIQQSPQVTAAWTLELLPEEFNQDAQSLSIRGTVVPISGLPGWMLCVLGSTCFPWNRMNIYLTKKKKSLQTSYQTEPRWHASTWVSHDTPWASMGHTAATDNCPISRLNALTCVKFEVHFLVPQMFLLKIKIKLQEKNSLQILGMKPLQ